MCKGTLWAKGAQGSATVFGTTNYLTLVLFQTSSRQGDSVADDGVGIGFRQSGVGGGVVHDQVANEGQIVRNRRGVGSRRAPVP